MDATSIAATRAPHAKGDINRAPFSTALFRLTVPFRSKVRALPLALLLLAACSHDPGHDPVQDTLTREAVAMHFEGQEREAARHALAPLLAREEPAFQDLIAGAAIEVVDGQTDAAKALLDRAETVRPNAPATRWLRGQIELESGGFDGFERALEHFQVVHEMVPDDLAARLLLGAAENEVGDSERAATLYESIIEVGPARGGVWYVAAVHRLGRLWTELGQPKKAQRYFDLKRDLEELGLLAPTQTTVILGEQAQIHPPEPGGIQVPEPGALGSFRAPPIALPELAQAIELFAQDLDDDGDTDLLSCGPLGVAIALQAEDGWTATRVTGNPTATVRAFDVDNDGDLDILLPFEDNFALFRCEKDESGARWELSTLELPTLPQLPFDLVAVDYDHEGDLDLVIVGAFGVRLWRNDGGDEPENGGLFVDATEGSGLPATRPFDWCLTEDWDGDNDVDILFGGEQGLLLADSLRGGHFADKTAQAFPASTRLAARPLVADVNGDGRPDLWPRGASTAWLQAADGSFQVSSQEGDDAPQVLCDLDLDGALDLVTGGAGSTASVRLAVGLDVERKDVAKTDPPGTLDATLVAADLDGDGDVDLASSSADGVQLMLSAGAPGNAKRLVLRGERDNRRAVGAIVEYRAGTVYRRIYWRGEAQLLGVGPGERVDVLRTTWPNGVSAARLDVSLEDDPDVDDAFDVYKQPQGQTGSCPFLYTWNGETFEFITDVLGTTPLGLPMAPGLLVPPDHDEFVLVRGEELAPHADGTLTLQFTEELREVTYLDQVRLIAVDHPEGTEVFPNERFTFPPFPKPHIHMFRERLAPVRALGNDGRDWAQELRAIDGEHANPFELEARQYAGLAKPWSLELEFDREALRGAKTLRLAMTGWFYWSDASANMASARHPRVEFVPPILQVPRGSNGHTEWIDAGPSIGFPAGKTKTMVIDVTDILLREDPRLRIVGTLRLYWDRIVLAIDGDDAPLGLSELAPVSAKLWSRGFSAPLDLTCEPGEQPADPSQPELFDWDVLADQPRWDQHPGLYTRFGDCRALVDEVDDMYAILGSGDALTVVFDGSLLPEVPEGQRRDWLVYLDGWAKDRDPNTIEALEVEPLPFHGMSAYPYPADEAFPATPEHNAWRAPAQRWLRPASPRGEVEWLLDG